MITKKGDGIYLDESVLKTITNCDGIIFDCDGVLIDITKSYDLTIDKTTQYVLENYADITHGITIDPKINQTDGSIKSLNAIFAGRIKKIACRTPIVILVAPIGITSNVHHVAANTKSANAV